jgi:membrane-bound ClpP family serine protease
MMRRYIGIKGGDKMPFYELLSNITVWSVVLFIVGIVLLVIELHIPGFGIFGVLGVIVLVVDIFITAKTFTQGLIMTAVLFVIVVVLMAVLASFVSKGRLPKGLTLKQSNSTEMGFSGAEDMKYLIGKSGTTITVLRPAGIVDFDGVRLDVITRGDYLEKATPVEVIEVEGNRIVVRAAK